MTDATKQALANSLRTLLYSKPLEKITVGEVSAGAGVNRQTFYYHFDNIIDLLLYASKVIGVAVVAESSFGSDFESDFAHLLTYFKDNKVTLNHIDPVLNKEAAEALFDGITHDFVYYYSEKASAGLGSSPKEIEEVTRFYGHAIKGVLYDYWKGDFTSNTQDIAHRTSLLMAGSLRNSLVNLLNNRIV